MTTAATYAPNYMAWRHFVEALLLHQSGVGPGRRVAMTEMSPPHVLVDQVLAGASTLDRLGQLHDLPFDDDGTAGGLEGHAYEVTVHFMRYDLV